MWGTRGITPSEIIFRAREGLWTLYERMGFDESIPNQHDVRSIEKDYPTAILTDTFNEKEQVCRFMREHFSDSIDETISYANDILSNRFLIFSDVYDFGREIEWHREYKSHKQIPRVFYRDINFLDPQRVGDKKLVWELNRHNFMVLLGKAYWLTGDRRYYEKWKEIIYSWIKENPYNKGINWASSLELSIRSINWIWSSQFFREELRNDQSLQELLFKTIYLHAIHIQRHLSLYFSPNTHLTGEALGLLYIGKSFPSMKSSEKWISLADAILVSELMKQTFSDGGYFEMATYYHKYTVDFYIHYLLVRGTLEGLGSEIISRIRKMIKHLVLISEPDGTIPLIGDSDGGQLLFLNLKKNNVKGSCCTAAVLLNDGELKGLCGSEFQEETLWLLGSSSVKRFELIQGIPLKSYHSMNHDTGLYCYRTGMEEKDNYILIDCGLHGWKVCGHAHSDLLSCEWYCNGVRAIVDPGTYTYTGSKELRDRSRVSQSHNTISFDGISQSLPGDPFRWRKIAKPKFVLSRYIKEYGYFEGTHDAYDDRGNYHKRVAVYFGPKLCVILDIIRTDTSQSSILYNLQFNTGRLVALNRNLYQFLRGSEHQSCYLKVFSTVDLETEIENSHIYPDYNKAIDAPRLNLEGNITIGDHIIFSVLCPDQDLAESFHYYENTRLRGMKDSSRYLISVREPIDFNDKIDPVQKAISVINLETDRMIMIVRNEKSVLDDSGDVKFDCERIYSYLAGIMDNKTLELQTDEDIGKFYFPYEIEKLLINEKSVPFTCKDAWITPE